MCLTLPKNQSLSAPLWSHGVICPKYIWALVYVQLFLLTETPQSTPPPHLVSYTRALLVSQDRRHLFVTPCLRHSPYMYCTRLVIYTYTPPIQLRSCNERGAFSLYTRCRYMAELIDLLLVEIWRRKGASTKYIPCTFF
jgi:hypothetical protein